MDEEIMESSGNLAMPERFGFMDDDDSLAATVRLSAILATIVGLPIAGFGLLLAFLGVGDFGTLSPLLRLLVILLFVQFMYSTFVFGGGTLLTASDIELTNNGIHLYPLKFWQLSIPWTSLKDTAGQRVRIRRRSLRRHMKLEYVFAFRIAGLLSPHIITGLLYGLGITPILAITPRHQKYEVLLEKLLMIAPQDPRTPAEGHS